MTSRLYGVVAGLTAGLAVLLSPVFLAIPDEVMADTLGALTVAAATVCWSVFFKERSWRSCCLFAVTATLSILTKGTGLGLALMPLIYVAFRRDAAFLLHPKTLAAAALVATLTAPWYLLHLPNGCGRLCVRLGVALYAVGRSVLPAWPDRRRGSSVFAVVRLRRRAVLGLRRPSPLPTCPRSFRPLRHRRWRCCFL